MEKQTIGQFLSALRRSNGFTQQEVAEKLGVSNKTVSCWERDSSYPDISVIPAIAEMYGVTCDEILRAKRAPVQPAQNASDKEAEAKSAANAEKAQKEASAIFANMLARYDNTHKIAVASAVFATVIGVIIASVLSFAVTEIYWSFIISALIAAVSLFVLYLVQYRLDFAIPADARSLRIRRKMYKRKKSATEFILLCAVYFIPYTQNLSDTSEVIAFGLAAVVVTLLFIIGAHLIRPLSIPEYYAKTDKVYAKKRFISYVTVISLAVVAFATFSIIQVNMPYPTEYNSGGYTTCSSLDSLKELANENTLPDKYRPAPLFPSVTDQYAEYIYYVNREDFDEKDLAGLSNCAVTGGIFDKTYTVYVLYPVWHVEYDRTDEQTGQTVTVCDSFIMFNRSYQTAFLQQRDDGAYVLRSFDTYDKITREKNKRHNNVATILRFGLADTVVALFIFLTVCGFLSYKKDNKNNAETNAQKAV